MGTLERQHIELVVFGPTTYYLPSSVRYSGDSVTLADTAGTKVTFNKRNCTQIYRRGED